MLEALYKQLIRFKIHHVLLWIGYFWFWASVYKGSYGSYSATFAPTFVYTVFNSICFYLVGYWLIPKFIHRQKILPFIIFLFLTIQATTVGLSVGLFIIYGQKLFSFFGNTFFIYSNSLMSNVFTTGLLLAIKSLIDQVNARANERRLEKARLESELQYLKAQVNPHFLFNVINSIHVLIRKDQGKASEMLIKLSDLLRFQLYDCSSPIISIEEEILYLRNYVDLEKLRKGNLIQIEFKIEGDLHGFSLPPLILIPFVENCFKYVSGDREGLSEIKI